MPVFEYRATSPDGSSVTGTILSASLGSAAEDLAKRGLEVASLQQAVAVGDPLAGPTEQPRFTAQAEPSSIQAPPTDPRSKVMTEVVGPLIGTVGLSHQMFFFRQLSTMIKAGVGMVQSLDTLASQTSDPKLRTVIREMRDHAQSGNPISAGMQRYPEVFSPLTLSLIRVGERGGMMEQSCAYIAHYIEREIEIRRLIKKVTFYPKVVVFASILIILAANAIIGALGKSGGLSSPLTEPATWIVLGPLIVAAFLFSKVGLRNPRIRMNFEQVAMALPGVGNTIRQFAMAKFGRAFGALYAGGVGPSEAIKLAADSCGNEFMRARIYPVASGLETGRGMAESFAATGVFSPIVFDMISTGERTGNVDGMLTKMAEFYEEEAQTRAYQLGTAFGVAVFLMVALYVGFIVVRFYSGYFGGISREIT